MPAVHPSSEPHSGLRRLQLAGSTASRPDMAIQMVSGFTAGATTCLLLHPLDLVKIRWACTGMHAILGRAHFEGFPLTVTSSSCQAASAGRSGTRR